MPKRERAGNKGSRKYITQKDVAERAGVSPSIVSYVINNGPRSISEDTRQRVLRAIAELEYRPNVHAQKLMRASWERELAPGQFGILIGGERTILRRPYYANLLVGILEEADQQNIHLRFFQFFDDLQCPVLFNKLINSEEVSAIILISTGPLMQSEEGLARLEQIRARVPNLVSIGRQLPAIPSVMVDLINAARQATDYLLYLGHRRVAYISDPNLRLNGYRQALEDHHIPFDPALFIDIGVAYTPADGYRGAQALLDSGLLSGEERVTAIMAGNDEVAMGVMRRLQESGINIPRDLSVMGIDNHELSVFCTPALSTIQLPHHQIGLLAVQTILQRIGRTDEPPSLTILPTTLIVRESCTPPN